jgi:spectinomycin phosphotransferase
MKTPPSADLNELKTSLDFLYGIQVKEIVFIPKGECSWGYRVDTTIGRSYFLKMYRGQAFPAWIASLTYHLCHQEGIEGISAPVPDRSGEMLVTLGGYPAELFDFISGQTLWQSAPSKEILFRLGQLIGRIHSCKADRRDCLRVEQFDIPGMEAYDRVVQAVRRKRAHSEAASTAVKLLRPVLSQLEELRDGILLYREKARKVAIDPCINHGDPTPGNILITSDGKLTLIDWDDMILAPPERDLVFWEQDHVFFDGISSAPVLEGYRSVTGKFELNPDLTGFYHRLWTLSEIAEYGQRLLFEEHDLEQNRSDLDNLREELDWL